MVGDWTAKRRENQGHIGKEKKHKRKNIEPLIIKNNISNEYRLFSMVITKKLH